MKILFLAWNRFKKGSQGHELFRRDLAKSFSHTVFFYGRDYYCNYNPNITLSEIFALYGKPDVIFTNAEYRERYSPKGIFTALGNIKDILKVHYCGDYYGEMEVSDYNKHFEKVGYDLIFVPQSQYLRRFQKYGVGGQHIFLPYSVDISTYYNQHLNKNFDVIALLTRNEKCRKRLRVFITRLDVRTSIQKVHFDPYVEKINEAKIFVTCNEKAKNLAWKYTEVLACGTLLMADKPEDFDKLGFKDGEHLILYDGLKDLGTKIEYFLKHDREREKIADNGMRFVQKYHSNKVRIKQLMEILEQELCKRRLENV